MLTRFCFDYYGTVITAKYRSENEIPLDGDNPRPVAYSDGKLVFGGDDEYTDLRVQYLIEFQEKTVLIVL